MEINIIKGQVDIVEVSGSIDALTATELVKALNDHIHAGHPNVIVDFAKVEFMSSAGLRAILTSVKEARAAGGDFRLASPAPSIDKILKMAGYHNILKIFPTVNEAQASFG
jgi:anti-anti-sigma factor